MNRSRAMQIPIAEFQEHRKQQVEEVANTSKE